MTMVVTTTTTTTTTTTMTVVRLCPDLRQRQRLPLLVHSLQEQSCARQHAGCAGQMLLLLLLLLLRLPQSMPRRSHPRIGAARSRD